MTEPKMWKFEYMKYEQTLALYAIALTQKNDPSIG